MVVEPRTPHRSSGFTLLELLAAMAVSMALLAVLFMAVENVSKTVRHTGGASAAFDEAWLALAEIRRQLGQATLSPYWAVLYDSAGSPVAYYRKSDLHFLSGEGTNLLPGMKTSGQAIFFQAPIGFDPQREDPAATQLNALGYFVEFRNVNADFPVDEAHFAAALPAKWRFQLREFRQPAGALKVMDPSAIGTAWFRTALSGAAPPVNALAENIALILFRVRIGEGQAEKSLYSHDSRLWSGTFPQPSTSHQLPATVDVVLLALDESTAIRICDRSDGVMPVLPVQGLFTDAARLDDDLAELETRLAGEWPGSGFRILRGAVSIRASRWSLDPTESAQEETP